MIQVPEWIAWPFGILIVIGGVVFIEKVFNGLLKLIKEGRDRGKLIELSALAVAVISAGIAAVALVLAYQSAQQASALEQRIITLEKALSSKQGQP